MISQIKTLQAAGVRSLTAAHILLLLHERVGNMGALALVTDVSTAAITGAVDTLEGLGLVERIRDTGDRRSVTAALTAAGKTLVEALTL